MAASAWTPFGEDLRDFRATIESTSMASTDRRIAGDLFDYARTGKLNKMKDLVEKLGKQEGYLDFALRVRNGDGMSVLHLAAAGGNKGVCQYLLETGRFDINMKDRKSGETPLHHAIFNGRFPAVVNFLLENGANPDVRTKKRRTALHYAVENVAGSRSLVQSLISKGADVNIVADCGTPLQLAAEKGKGELVKLLLAHKADPNVISHDLFSPLLASISGQSLECMNQLLKAKADPNSSTLKGIPPLKHAVLKGFKSKDIINILLEYGAKTDDVDVLGMTPVEHAALNNKNGLVSILFPLTSPIKTIPEWSTSGLHKQVHSVNASKEREKKTTDLIVSSKSRGGECFNQSNYFEAIQWYTQALSFDHRDAADTLYQLSQCWARMEEWGLALENAEACMELRPHWPNMYLQAGHWRMQLEEYEAAIRTLCDGATWDPENADIKEALRQACGHRLVQKALEF